MCMQRTAYVQAEDMEGYSRQNEKYPGINLPRLLPRQMLGQE